MRTHPGVPAVLGCWRGCPPGVPAETGEPRPFRQRLWSLLRAGSASPGRVGGRLASWGCLASASRAPCRRALASGTVKQKPHPCPRGPGLAGNFKRYPLRSLFGFLDLSAHAPVCPHAPYGPRHLCFHGCARPSLTVSAHLCTSERNPGTPIFLRPAARGVPTLLGSPYSGHFT